jgi:hypothetical protein
MRRYKYLEKMHEEEMNKILVYLKGFTDDERKRLAQVRRHYSSHEFEPRAELCPLRLN